LKDASLIASTVADLTKAKRFFRELIGADPYVDSPGYVGYKSGDMEMGSFRAEINANRARSPTGR